MKQLNLKHDGREYQVILSLDGCGFCEVSIYRKRLKKKWFQGNWESFTYFVTAPSSMAELTDLVESKIKEKSELEAAKESFLKEYRSLENF